MGGCTSSTTTDSNPIVDTLEPPSSPHKELPWISMNTIIVTSKDTNDKECEVVKAKHWTDLHFHEGRDSIKMPHELAKDIPSAANPPDGEVLDRVKGSMLGMALGDALGAHVEFRPHSYMLEHPVKDLEGGGTWGLQKGQFTDDTSMALCLANSLVASRGFAPYDQLVRYKWWYRHGYMSSTGQCFDIGAATKQSIYEFERRQDFFAKQHQISSEKIDYCFSHTPNKSFNVFCSHSGVAGNGALMRLAPVPLFFYRYPKYAVEYSGVSGEITHGDKKVYDACRYYGALLVKAMEGKTKEELLDNEFYTKNKQWFNGEELVPEVVAIANGSYKKQGGYEDGIRGKGYILNALEAALWALWSDKGSFKDGVCMAVNLGDDTDTTAAIYGQLAGAHYGYKKLPQEWLEHVYARDYIEKLSEWIVFEGRNWDPKKTYTPNTDI